MIKKQIVIDIEYGSEWQYNFHHKNLMIFLKGFEYQMFSDTNYTTFRHKDNRLEISGDTELEENKHFIEDYGFPELRDSSKKIKIKVKSIPNYFDMIEAGKQDAETFQYRRGYNDGINACRFPEDRKI